MTGGGSRTTKPVGTGTAVTLCLAATVAGLVLTGQVYRREVESLGLLLLFTAIGVALFYANTQLFRSVRRHGSSIEALLAAVVCGTCLLLTGSQAMFISVLLIHRLTYGDAS